MTNNNYNIFFTTGFFKLHSEIMNIQKLLKAFFPMIYFNTIITRIKNEINLSQSRLFSIYKPDCEGTLLNFNSNLKKKNTLKCLKA